MVVVVTGVVAVIGCGVDSMSRIGICFEDTIKFRSSFTVLVDPILQKHRVCNVSINFGDPQLVSISIGGSPLDSGLLITILRIDSLSLFFFRFPLFRGVFAVGDSFKFRCISSKLLSLFFTESLWSRFVFSEQRCGDRFNSFEEAPESLQNALQKLQQTLASRGGR